MKKDYTNLKKGMLVVGVLIIIFGVIFLFLGFTSGSTEENDSNFLIGSHEGFGRSLMYLAIGGFMIIPGLFLIYLSQIGKVFSYVATEGSPGIETVSTALGKGLGSGLKESGVVGSDSQKQIIKVKCPQCGYLETEDAEFCSKCGKKFTKL